MQGRHAVEQVSGGGALGDAARVHDQGPVACPGDHAQVVGDHKQGRSLFGGQLGDQVENPRLNDDVERGGRLVGDQQTRAAGQGDGQDDALALAAGELVGIEIEGEPCRGQADPIEQSGGPVPRGGPRQAEVQPQALRDLPTDRPHRIERAHGFLEHHGQGPPTQGAEPFLVRRQQVLAVEQDPAAGGRGLGQQAHDGQRGHRFSAAGLADQTQTLAGLQDEGNPVQNARRTARRGDGDGQVLNREQGGHGAYRARRRRGSSRSRKPSPRRLRPSTVRAMARPGKTASRGALNISVWASFSILPQLGRGGWVPRPR